MCVFVECIVGICLWYMGLAGRGGVLDSAVPSHPVCLRVYFRREAPPPSPSSTLASPEDRGLSVTWEVLLLLMMGRGSPLGAPAVTAVEDTQRRLHPALPWV